MLEARERVGGRTHGIEVAPGRIVDAGAAYLGHRHTALKVLIAELGLRTTPTSMSGDSTFALAGAPVRCAGRFPPLKAVALGEMFELLDELTRRVRLDAPWLGPDAARLDTLTAAEWAEQNLAHADARLFFPLFLGEMMAADPRDVSVLHMAFYLRSGGGIRYLNAFEGGAQEERIDGGAQQLCVTLAARLGERVKLGQPVRAVQHTAGGVSVESRRAAFDADAVDRRAAAAPRGRHRLPAGASSSPHERADRARLRGEAPPDLSGAALARSRPVGLVDERRWAVALHR